MGNKYLEEAQLDVGKKFGKLTITKVTDQRSKDRKIIVKCLCDCGNESYVRLSTLRTGAQESCGCSASAVARENGQKALSIMVARGKWNADPKIGTAKRIYRHSYSDGDLSFEQFLELSQQNCFYCGCYPANGHNGYTRSHKKKYSEARIRDGYFQYNGLDRVDNTRGHDKDNVVPCCEPCNKAKLTRTQQAFFVWIKLIYDLHILNRM